MPSGGQSIPTTSQCRLLLFSQRLVFALNIWPSGQVLTKKQNSDSDRGKSKIGGSRKLPRYCVTINADKKLIATG